MFETHSWLMVLILGDALQFTLKSLHMVEYVLMVISAAAMGLEPSYHHCYIVRTSLVSL